MEELSNLTPTFNPFHPREAEWYRTFAAFRVRFFRPLLVVFRRIGVSPDALSLCGVLIMLFLPFGFLGLKFFFIVTFVLQILFDWLDGALARFMKVTSDRGAYLDTVADHISMVFTVFTLVWFGLGNPFWQYLYMTSYLLLVIHFVVMNTMGIIPKYPIIRTKLLLYLFVTLFGFGVISPVILDGFFRIVGSYYAIMLGSYTLWFWWNLPTSPRSSSRPF